MSMHQKIISHLFVRNRKLLMILGVAFLVCTTTTLVWTSSPSALKQRAILQIILNNVKALHYAPKPLNDDFSKSVFSTFIKQLDPNKQFFLQEDIQYLKQYETKIDNQILDQSFEFYNEATNRFFMRIKDIRSFYPELLSKPFDFTRDETMETNPDKVKFAANLDELRSNWAKQLKYRTLISYFDMLSDAKSVSGNSGAGSGSKKVKNDRRLIKKSVSRSTMKSMLQIESTTVFDPKLEEKARKKVEKNTQLLLNRIEQNRDDLTNQYLNAILSVYDPHTDYYPPEEKENFDIGMTGKLEGIGAVLTEEDGYIKVLSIVPGSAAYIEKELEVGDIILKVGEGNAEAIDIVSMRVQDAVKFIRGKKGSEVRLTVKKPDGRIVLIPIIRDVVIIEETYARTSVIKSNDTNKLYGYILLPKFYRDFTNNRARNSTDDMIKAIEKLKKHQVNGIILDLRNNGGGSLKDAVDIAGLFIGKGPVVQVKNKYDKVMVLEDDNKMVVYKGPLIILINNMSASASEILSAALQDYHRAILVGTPSFGKGSVQTFVDLDNFVRRNYSYLYPLGSLKLTIQLFFRINGDAVQFKGVVPDVVLPDVFSSLDLGERKLPYALDFCTVNMTEYKPYDMYPKLETAKFNSRNRVKESPVFKKIIAYSQSLKEKQSHTLQSLNFNAVKADQILLRKEVLQLKDIQSSNTSISVIPLEKKVTTPSSIDPKEWNEQVKKDVYLEESVRILNDLTK